MASPAAQHLALVLLWHMHQPEYRDSAPATVSRFDRLFRAHLANLYRMLELPVPAGV